MAVRPRPGSMRCWPSISGSSPSTPKRRRSTSGATIPRRSPRPRWRRAPPAKRVAGGWRLSGRFPFSSGCDYAQWAILGAFLGEMGDPRHIAYLLAPLAEVEIVDDWQVLGLAGTGSKSLVLHDVFIPEHRCVMVSDLFAGTPPGALVHPDYPVLRAPRGFLVSYSLPPVAIALGRRALDIACATLGGPGVARRDQARRIRGRADGDRRGRRGDRCRDDAAAHRARIQHRSGQLGPQDHRGRGIARPARHGLRAAPGELGGRPPVRVERRPLGL